MQGPSSGQTCPPLPTGGSSCIRSAIPGGHEELGTSGAASSPPASQLKLCCHVPFLSHLHSHTQGQTLEPQKFSTFQKLPSYSKEKF